VNFLKFLFVFGDLLMHFEMKTLKASWSIVERNKVETAKTACMLYLLSSFFMVTVM